MSKKKEELETLVQIIAQHPSGISTEELFNFLNGKKPGIINSFFICD